MNQSTNEVNRSEGLWTSQQCADYLGITKKALYLKLYRGELPCIKMGTNNSRLRFDPAEIRAFVDAHRVKAFKGV